MPILLALMAFLAVLTPINCNLPTEVVYQFPLGQWCENIAILKNGNILVTRPTSPSLYMIDPAQMPFVYPQPVYTFPDVLSIVGIVEFNDNMIYVSVENSTSVSTFTNAPYPSSLFELDLRHFSFSSGAGAVARNLTHGPGPINGMTELSYPDSMILLADSFNGTTWKLNVETGNYLSAVDVPQMKKSTGPGFSIGINGIKIRNGLLYFTNTFQESFSRVPIDEHGNQVGDVETLATGIIPDDFCFDALGNAFITRNVENIVSVWSANDGSLTDVAGEALQLTVAGPTACQFGRGRLDKKILYVTTAGGLAKAINGTIIEGGKVVRIDTAGFVVP